MLPFFDLQSLHSSSKVLVVGDDVSLRTKTLDSVCRQGAFVTTTVVRYDNGADAPLERGSAGFVAAAVSPEEYWEADTQLDPDVVFINRPETEASEVVCIDVFCDVVRPRSHVASLLASLQPTQSIVIDFAAREEGYSPWLFTFSF